jgi:pre-mRNA-processing factor 6
MGMGAQKEDVVRCQAAEPSHGETWQPIAKDDKNGGNSAKEILELVAAACFGLNILSCNLSMY